ncbi:MAG: PD40 domain-containing protein [Chitinophagales bacterium]|nr:PD40 domain-containing protein [Hyphomicrobiales bacterium]
MIKRISKSPGSYGSIDSFAVAVSPNGRYVAFSSLERVTLDDTNNNYDIFVYDTILETVKRLNIPNTGSVPISSISISSDGDRVAFSSQAAHVSSDTNAVFDIYVHDVDSATTRLISAGKKGRVADGASFDPILSDDGSTVTFWTEAKNLVKNKSRAVVEYDLDTGKTSKVADGSVFDSSGDGKFNAVIGYVKGNSNIQALIYEDGVKSGKVISKNSAGELSYSVENVHISDNGRFATFTSFSSNLVDGDTNGRRDVFVFDSSSNRVSRLSVSNEGKQLDRESIALDISADGRFVLWKSEANTIVPGDSGFFYDIFVTDLASGLTTILSLNPLGELQFGDAFGAKMSKDGTQITFVSEAANLSSNDFGRTKDVFVVKNPFLATPILGTTGDDSLEGTTGRDVIKGGAGNDLLDGKTNADFLEGGEGDDTYILEVSTDVAIEKENEGLDTVKAAFTYTLAAAFENLTLTGPEHINGTGNAKNNHIRGNDGYNTLYGLEGDDILDGGVGVDQLYGGAGNDTYILDDELDKVHEDANGGVDHVKSYSNLNWQGNVEIYELVGNENTYVTGSPGDDTLNGNNGNNIITGNSGRDTMIGGAGNDTYNYFEIGDVIFEDVDGGIDTIATRELFITLPENVENYNNIWRVTGADGNALDNVMVAAHGDERIDGKAGDDTLVALNFGSVLTGGEGNDTFEIHGGASITDFTIGEDKIALELDRFASLGQVGELSADMFVVGDRALDANDFIIYNKETVIFIMITMVPDISKDTFVLL